MINSGREWDWMDNHIENEVKINKMKISIHKIESQLYLLPFVKVTYDKVLNGSYEFVIGWFNIGLSISYTPKRR